MKNLHIKTIQEENRGLEDSFLTQSDSGYKASSHHFAKKRSSLSKNEFYAKYLKKNFDFSQDDDLQVIYDIIQKPNNSKSNLDLMILQNAFKNIRLFQELENEIPQKQMFNLYRELLHYEYQPRQIVFNQGEIGREFYIILKGSVYIIGNEDKKQQDNPSQEQQESENQQNIKEEVENTNEQKPVQKQQPLVQTNTSKLARRLSKKSSFVMYSQILDPNNQTLQRKQTLERSPSFVQQGKFLYNSLKRTTSLIYDIDEDITDEEYIKLNFPDFDILAKLESGASFGEVALRDSVPRTATAICSGETHFITLKRDAFKRFLEQYYSVVQQQNINFVKKIALFSNWTDQMINQMFYYLEKKTFRMNQTIYKEGSDSLGIYLIREGEVKLYQEMQLPQNEQDRLKNVRHFMRKIDFAKQQNIFYAPVSHLAQGQMFGHEDIVNSTQRKYTAICSSSNCQILFLNKERFLQLSKRRNTIENAFEESAMKQEWHSQLISNLESFTKNQNEFIKRQESQKYKLLIRNNIQEGKRNSQIFENNNSKTHRRSNQSLPSSLLNKQNCQIVDFTNQQSNHLKAEINSQEPNNLNLQEKLLKHQKAIKENKNENLQQIILLKQNCQIKPTKNDLKCKQDILDAFMSSATAENTPLQSEKLIRHSSNKNLFQKNQDVSVIIEDQRLKTDSSKQRRPLSGLSFDIQRNSEAKQVCQTISSMGNIDLPYQKIQASQSQVDISEQQINDFQYQSDQKHKSLSSNQQKKLRKILESNSKANKNESPIRKQSINQDFLRQLIDNSLHVPKRIQQSLLTCQEDSQIYLEQQGLSKLDIDNQIIPTCQSMHLFKKRILNKYPKLANEQKESNQLSLKQQINDLQMQQRILKSLKLPKIRKNSSNFIDIFMPIEPQSQKNLDQIPPIKEFNSSFDLSNQKIIQPNLCEIRTPVKRNKSQNSISIIETLKNLKQELVEKKIKSDVQIKDKSDLFRRKNLSQSNLLDEKHVFDLKKLTQQNYNFQNKFNEINHNPTILQLIFTKPNKIEESKK
ncbi:hypothetical protein ABPG74_010422 [Tetrahymena malaccensis]